MKSSPATTWSMTWKIMSHESAVPHINTLLLLARLIGARFQGRPSRDYLWGSMFAMSRHQSQQTSTRWSVNYNSFMMKIHEEVNFLDLSNTHQISVPPPQIVSIPINAIGNRVKLLVKHSSPTKSVIPSSLIYSSQSLSKTSDLDRVPKTINCICLRSFPE